MHVRIIRRGNGIDFLARCTDSEVCVKPFKQMMKLETHSVFFDRDLSCGVLADRR